MNRLLTAGLGMLVFSMAFAAQSAEVYFTPSKECENRIVEAIDNSKKEISIAVYSINNKKITEAIEAAHKKGLKIRVLTDSLQAAGKSSRVVEIADAGVDLRVHSVSKIMHNKFAIFDNASAVSGSFNWTGAASNQNSENCVFFTEPNVLQSYKTQFEKLWTINTFEKSQIKLSNLRNRVSSRIPSNE